jgi:hypothetical protein
MDEVYLRALLEHATSEEPSMGQLVGDSLRAGKKLAKRRRIEAAIAAGVGIALVAIAVPAALGALAPARHTTGPATHRHGPPPPAPVKTARGTAYVWGQDQRTITAVSLRTDKVLKSFKIPGYISTIAAAPNGKVLYLFSFQGAHNYETPISTATNKIGRRVTLSVGLGVASPVEFAPNGRIAYAISQYALQDHRLGMALFSINLATGAEHKLLATGSGPFEISPNGRTAYVQNVGQVIDRVDLVTGRQLKPITLASRLGASDDAAFSPDSRSAYITSAASNIWVTPVDVATGAQRTPIALPRPSSIIAWDIAVNPKGTTAYVYGSTLVTPVDLARGTVLKSVRVPVGANSWADFEIAPGGSVGYSLVSENSVFAINTVSNKAIGQISLPRGYVNTRSLAAFAANGSVLYIPAGYGPSQAGAIVPINTATQQVGKPIKVPDGAPQQIIVVP